MQDLIQRLRPNVCPIARTLHEGRDLLQMVVGEFDVKRRETSCNDVKLKTGCRQRETAGDCGHLLPRVSLLCGVVMGLDLQSTSRSRW